MNLKQAWPIHKTRTTQVHPLSDRLDHRPVTVPSIETGAGSGSFT
jgi:hypothetical protein